MSPTKPEPAGDGGRLAAGGGGSWRGPQPARLMPYWHFWYSAPGLPAPEGAGGADASTESGDVRGVVPCVGGGSEGSDGSGLEGGGGV